MSTQDLQRIVTGKVRLSFAHLFTPYSNRQGKDPKFSATLLIPKSDFATRQRIDAAINAAIQVGISKDWGGQRPPLIHMPIHDGDGVKPSDGMPFGPECKGHWVMTASSKPDRRPEIVDLNMNPIINQSEIYSGVFAKVSIRFFAYSAEGKKGIGCGLGNVQKVEDGPALAGGGQSAASDFGGSDAYAPPAYGGQQQQYQPPAQQGYQQSAPAYQQQPQYQQPQHQQPAQPNYAQPPQQPMYQQPQYQQPPAQPNYAQQPMQLPPVNYPPQQVQIDPITGRPLVGGIMGL